MILSYGTEPYMMFKHDYTRYRFFADPFDRGADAIYGLERPLTQLVDFFKSARPGATGPSAASCCLHGPVGSSKSTIARLLKKGPGLRPTQDRKRAGSTPTRGALGEKGSEAEEIVACPMHEEPLLLIPAEARGRTCSKRSIRKCPMGRRFKPLWGGLPFLPQGLRRRARPVRR